jgi:hypothetical protein
LRRSTGPACNSAVISAGCSRYLEAFSQYCYTQNSVFAGVETA